MARRKKQRSRRRFMKEALAVGSVGVAASYGAGYAQGAAAPVEDAAVPVRLTRSLEGVQEELFEYARAVDVIDAHEHLLMEPQRLALDADVLLLLSQYTYVDLSSAGFEIPGGESWYGYNYPQDTKISLDERWKKLWPSIQNVKYGSYFRAAAIALRDIYGIDDLNPDTYKEASKRIKANNTPGLYHRILRDKCRIKRCLVQNGPIEGQQPADLLTPVYTGTNDAVQLWNTQNYEEMQKRTGSDIADLDAYLEVVKNDMQWTRDHGAVGCKVFIIPDGAIDMEVARKEFKEFVKGAPAGGTLRATIFETIITKAGEMGWPIAVHTGIWGDYRTVDPKFMIARAQRHPNVRFDLYHLGMPFVRDYIFVGKNFPNVNLNLCWSYIVSQDISRRSINEIIDTVPVNKVIGFGGDYTWGVENVYGHLYMAQETLAEALAERVQRGAIDVDGAKHIIKLWMYDNPVGFYDLRV